MLPNKGEVSRMPVCSIPMPAVESVPTTASALHFNVFIMPANRSESAAALVKNVELRVTDAQRCARR